MTTNRATQSKPAPPTPASAPRSGGPSVAAGERIVLRKPGGHGTLVDGGWWPTSLDLIAELPAVLAASEAAGYAETRRVSFALAAWDGLPPVRSTMRNRVVKLGGFRSLDPAELGLVDSSGWKRIMLVVVPPDTDPVIAGRALAMAGTDGDSHSAGEILDLAQGTPTD
jgi:hypothetical protein